MKYLIINICLFFTVLRLWGDDVVLYETDKYGDLILSEKWKKIKRYDLVVLADVTGKDIKWFLEKDVEEKDVKWYYPLFSLKANKVFAGPAKQGETVNTTWDRPSPNREHAQSVLDRLVHKGGLFFLNKMDGEYIVKDFVPNTDEYFSKTLKEAEKLEPYMAEFADVIFKVKLPDIAVDTLPNLGSIRIINKKKEMIKIEKPRLEADLLFKYDLGAVLLTETGHPEKDLSIAFVDENDFKDTILLKPNEEINIDFLIWFTRLGVGCTGFDRLDFCIFDNRNIIVLSDHFKFKGPAFKLTEKETLIVSKFDNEGLLGWLGYFTNPLDEAQIVFFESLLKESEGTRIWPLIVCTLCFNEKTDLKDRIKKYSPYVEKLGEWKDHQRIIKKLFASQKDE